MTARDLLAQRIDDARSVLGRLRADEHLAFAEQAAGVMASSLRDGGTVLLCGNGGSAADAMHLAAELVGRFRLDRAALPALALSDSQAGLTCVANDFSFDDVFVRPLQAFGRPGDVLLGLSTSGSSPNVVKALEAAGAMGLHRIGITGAQGGRLPEVTDLCLRVPSDDTARVQEATMLVGHTLCELVEAALAA